MGGENVRPPGIKVDCFLPSRSNVWNDPGVRITIVGENAEATGSKQHKNMLQAIKTGGRGPNIHACGKIRFETPT